MGEKGKEERGKLTNFQSYRVVVSGEEYNNLTGEIRDRRRKNKAGVHC